jgi:dynein heavy chain 1, cytosolic
LFLLLARVNFRAYCRGEAKTSNFIRETTGALNQGRVPKHWLAQYAVANDISLGAWISDLALRAKGLGDYRAVLSRSGNASGSYWLGGMFVPEAFVTATRQQTAQVTSRNSESCSWFFAD